MKHIKKFNENISDEILILMNKFNISEIQAKKLDKIIDKIYSKDDIDERMDYVDELDLERILSIEEDKIEDIIEYLKNICID